MVLNRQEALAVWFLSGALLVGSIVTVLDHLYPSSFEDFHVVHNAVPVPQTAIDEPGTDGSADASSPARAAAPEPVPINQASAVQLQALPKVGPRTAAAIVEYRQLHGPFQSVDELAGVRGIGVATVQRLRPLVSVD